MDEKKLDNTIQFIIEQQARFSTDIEALAENQKRTDAQVAALIESQRRTDAQIQSMIGEMREGFENLIIANEVTRSLTNQIGELLLQHAQRITRIEERTGDHDK